MLKYDVVGETYCFPAGSIMEVDVKDCGTGTCRIGPNEFDVMTFTSIGGKDSNLFIVNDEIEQLKTAIDKDDGESLRKATKKLLDRITYQCPEILTKPPPVEVVMESSSPAWERFSGLADN